MQSKDYALNDVKRLEDILSNKNVYLIRDFPKYKDTSGNKLEHLDDS